MSIIIHPNDDMFTGSIEHYDRCGKEFAELIFEAAKSLKVGLPKILELPCGYGRVTRHLVKLFPPEQVDVADAMSEAVRFNVKQHGVQGFLVRAPLNKLNEVPFAYDIAAMGSLITHLSETNSREVLVNFLSKLKPAGKAIVTTHGRRAFDIVKSGQVWFELENHDRANLMESYLNERFGHVQYASGHSFESKTVASIGTSYGISLIPHSWMTKTLGELGFCIDEVRVGGWDNHQDVYFISRK